MLQTLLAPNFSIILAKASSDVSKRQELKSYRISFLFGFCKPLLAQSCEFYYYGLNYAWHSLRFFFSCKVFKIDRSFEKPIAKK